MAGELASEQKDHAEAIDNMMDMLEKTCTHDDLSDAMDSQYADLLQELGSTAGTSTSAVLSPAKGAAAVTSKPPASSLAGIISDDGAAAVGMASNGGSFPLSRQTGFEARCLEMMAEVERVVPMIDTVEDKVSQMLAQQAQHIGGLEKDVVEGTARSLSEMRLTMKKHYESIKNQHERETNTIQKLATTVQAFNAKMDNTTQILTQKVEIAAVEVDRQLAENSAALDSKLEQWRHTVNKRLDSSVTSMSKQLTAVEKTALSEVSAIKQRVESHRTAMIGQLEADTAAMKLTVSTAVTDVSSTLHAKLGQQSADMNDGMKQLNERVALRLEQNSQDMAKQKTDMLDLAEKLRCDAADSKAELEAKSDQISERLEASKRLQHDKNEGVALTLGELKAAAMSNREEAKGEREKMRADCEERFLKVNGRVDTDHEHFSTMCSDMDKRFVDKQVQQEQLIESHNQKLTAGLASLDARVTEMNESYTARFEQATETTERHHQAHRNLCVELEARIGNKVEAAENSVDKLRASFADGCSRLDAKSAELEERLTDFVQDRIRGIEEKLIVQQADVSDRCTKLRSDLAESEQNLESRWSTKMNEQAQLAHGLVTRVSGNEAKLKQVDERSLQTDKAVSENQGNLMSIVNRMQSSFADKGSAQEAALERMRAKVDTTLEKCTRTCDDAERQSTALVRRLEQVASDCDGRFQRTGAQLEELDHATHGELRTLSEGVTTLAGRAEQLRGEVEYKIQMQQENLGELVVTIDRKFSEKCAAQDARAADAQSLFAQECERIHEQSRAADAQHDKRFTEMNNELYERSQELSNAQQSYERRATEREATLSDKIFRVDESTREFQREIQEMTLSTAQKIADQGRAFDDQIADQRQAQDSAADRVERKLHALDLGTTKRADLMQGKLEELDRHVGLECSRVEASLKSKTAETTEMIKRDYEYFKQECGALRERLTGVGQLLDKKFAERATVMMDKLIMLDETVVLNQKFTNEMCSDLEVKFTERQTSAETQIRKQRDIFTEILSKMERSQVERDRTQNEAIEGQHQFFMAQLGDMDARVHEQHMDLQQDMEASRQEVMDMCEAQNARLGASVEEQKHTLESAVAQQASDLDAAKGAMETRATRLEQQITATVDASISEQNGRIENLENDVNNKLMGAVSALETKFEEDLKPLQHKAEALQGKMTLMAMDLDENKSGIQQLAAALNDLNETVDAAPDTSAVDAKIADLDEQVKDMAIDCFFWKCVQDAGPV